MSTTKTAVRADPAASEWITAYSVETHPLQMTFIHIGGSQTHAKLGNYSLINRGANC